MLSLLSSKLGWPQFDERVETMIYHGSQESDPHVWLKCHGFGPLGERRQEEEEKLAENSSDKI